MRRMRNKDATKVWHNPEILSGSRSRAPDSARAVVAPLLTASQDLAADEASNRGANAAATSTTPKPGRIILKAPVEVDPRAAERQKLLANLLRASGRPAVSKAANDFLGAGFVFPDAQDVHLQLLEHANEDHVCTAIEKLGVILAGESPQRRAVLESRLRRIEQFADEASTRAAAERLRRQVSGLGPSSPIQ